MTDGAIRGIFGEFNESTGGVGEDVAAAQMIGVGAALSKSKVFNRTAGRGERQGASPACPPEPEAWWMARPDLRFRFLEYPELFFICGFQNPKEPRSLYISENGAMETGHLNTMNSHNSILRHF